MLNTLNSIKENLKWAIPTDKFYLSDLIQIIIIFFLIYYVIKTLKDTRAWIIVKGLAIVFFAYALVYLSSLSVIQYMMEQIFGLVTIAIVIMFQPELRKILEGIGKRNIVSISKQLKNKSMINDDSDGLFSKKTVDEVVIACSEMAKAKTGALIVFEKEIPLVDYINSGIDVNATISNQLILNIFEKNTPLHDGAVIVKDNKIQAATCYLPLSDNSNIKKSLGTRHRAGIGITEVSDAFVIIVSEETGGISWCENGKLKHNISSKELTDKMRSIKIKDETFHKKNKKTKPISNLITKLLVAIASVIIWAIILNINDEVKTIEFEDIPVQIVNDSAISNIDQTYEVIDGSTIDVEIKGKRSTIENIKRDDILAIANFDKLSYVFSVPIEVKLKNDLDAIIEITPKSSDVMIVQLEEIVEMECPIEVKTIGVKEDNYYVFIEKTSPELLKVVGPKSKVNVLDKAIVEIDVTGKTSNFVAAATPILYDKNGEIVDTKNITFNIEQIKVNASVYETKEVPLNIFLKNNYTNNYYYELLDVVSDKNTILVASDNETLETLEQIDIPIELNDNNDAISSSIININNYLPKGVYLANNQEELLQLSLELNKYTKTTLRISSDDIKVHSLNPKYDIQYVAIPNTIEMYVNEELISLDELSVALLNPVIKIEDNSSGNFETELRLTNIDGVLYNSNLNVEYLLFLE